MFFLNVTVLPHSLYSLYVNIKKLRKMSSFFELFVGSALIFVARKLLVGAKKNYCRAYPVINLSSSLEDWETEYLAFPPPITWNLIVALHPLDILIPAVMFCSGMWTRPILSLVSVITVLPFHFQWLLSYTDSSSARASCLARFTSIVNKFTSLTPPWKKKQSLYVIC